MCPLAREVASLVQETIGLLDPYQNFKSKLKVSGESLCIDSTTFSLQNKIHIFGLGKAASFEVSSFKKILCEEGSKDQIAQCVAYTKKGHTVGEIDLVELEGSHPQLTEKNIQRTLQFIKLLKKIPAEDTLIFLLSGGGSALLELPKKGVTTRELILKNTELLLSGKSIGEINSERQKFSQVKAGGLLNFIKTRNILQLVTCDIPSENINLVSSGPLAHKDVLSALTQSSSLVIDNLCKKAGRKPGAYYDCSLEEGVNHLRNNLPHAGECLISGGELPVSLPNHSFGIGGRNTHFVLAFAHDVYKNPQNRDLIIMSFATDGGDGETDAAGAYLNFELYKKLDATTYLENFDSYTYFEKLKALIKTGPTKSNIMDLRFLWRS